MATRRDKTRLNHGEDYVEEIDPEEATLADVSDLHGTVHNPVDTTQNKKKPKSRKAHRTISRKANPKISKPKEQTG